MKKVLVVICTSFVSYGGLATVMMNYYRAMDKTEMQIDFASTNEVSDELQKELRKKNSKYYCLGNRKKSPVMYFQKLYGVLKRNQYDVIHINGNSATMAVELAAAKMAHVPKRIAHVHNSRNLHTKLNMLLYPIMEKLITDRVAVSLESGQKLYKNKEFRMLNNAIDCQHFQYNPSVREKYRKELGYKNDSLVIGTLGKINKQKNHQFLIKVFSEVVKSNPNARLLLVGDGELREAIEQDIRKYGLEEFVLLLGMRNDVPELLSVMDLFAFPSLYEGLSLALLQAQASGLPCLVSNTISPEGCISDYCQMLSIDSIDGWVEAILRFEDMERDLASDRSRESLAKAGFDIETQSEVLRKVYLDS